LDSEGLLREAPIVILMWRISSVRVNFMALVMRLMRTWRTRLGSNRVHWMLRARKESSSMKSSLMSERLSSASNIFIALLTSWSGCDGSGETRRRFESSLESVRMSSMIRFWCMAQYMIVSAASTASSSRYKDLAISDPVEGDFPEFLAAFRKSFSEEIISSAHPINADKGFLISCLVELSVKAIVE